MTNEELAIIEARAKAATPESDYSKDRISLSFISQNDRIDGTAAVWYDDGDLCAEVHANLGLGIFDPTPWAALFAHARTDIPALITEVRRLQDALEETIKFNPLRNDRDAYLLAVSEWGLKGKWGVDEEFTERPNVSKFGLE